MNSVKRDASPPWERQGNLTQLIGRQDLIRRLAVGSSSQLGLPLLLRRVSGGILRVPLARPEGAGGAQLVKRGATPRAVVELDSLRLPRLRALKKPVRLPGAVIERLFDPVAPGAPIGSNERVEGVMDRSRQLGRVLPRRVDIGADASGMGPHHAEPPADVGVWQRCRVACLRRMAHGVVWVAEVRYVRVVRPQPSHNLRSKDAFEWRLNDIDMS